VVIVTPGGDEGSPAGWVIARYLAKRHRSVAVVDLTGDAITTRAMLGTSDVPGLFNVLSGRATLVETIFEDRESSAHVLPAGKIDGTGATASLDRLKDLLAQLDRAYDYTVVDCGYAGLDGIARVAQPDTVVVVSTAGSDLSSARALENDLRHAGYPEAILVRSEETAGSEVVAA
jgi:Mrp family chromosome partitioning ATPase